MDYSFMVTGTAADDQTWSVNGIVSSNPRGPMAWPEVVEIAMQKTFLNLNQGKAIFGRPGVGCRGPYRILKMTVERK